MTDDTWPPWVADWAARPQLRDDAKRQLAHATACHDTKQSAAWAEVLRRMDAP